MIEHDTFLKCPVSSIGYKKYSLKNLFENNKKQRKSNHSIHQDIYDF